MRSLWRVSRSCMRRRQAMRESTTPATGQPRTRHGPQTEHGGDDALHSPPTSAACARADAGGSRQEHSLRRGRPTLKVVKASDATSKLATSTYSKNFWNSGPSSTILAPAQTRPVACVATRIPERAAPQGGRPQRVRYGRRAHLATISCRMQSLRMLPQLRATSGSLYLPPTSTPLLPHLIQTSSLTRQVSRGTRA